MNKIEKAKRIRWAHFIRGHKMLTRTVMRKIEGTKSRGKQRLMWLQTLKTRHE